MIRLAVLALLVVLVGSRALDVGSIALVPLGVGVLLVVGGAVLGKIRPNWLFGIRIPWTLSSKRSWVKTHRLGGWLFIAWGLVAIAGGLLLSGGPIPVMIGVIMGVVVVIALLAMYSYLAWRDDADKEPAISSRPAP